MQASLLPALSYIESRHRDKARGRAGEVSRYQVMPYVWREYKGRNPRDKAEADRVALRILTDRTARFTALRKRPPTTAETYLLWARPAWAYRGHWTPVLKERANRFAAAVKGHQP